MKLFGGGKPEKKPGDAGAHKDDDAGYFDSPTETVSLSAPPVAKPSAATVTPPKEEPPVSLDYGINAAIQLMRSLPVDQNPELVVTVIKTTLESMRVKVTDIIEDAGRKQADLEKRVANLKKEISDYEREIEQRKEEIARLDADHAETTNVKARLELAEKSNGQASSKSKASTKAETKPGS